MKFKINNRYYLSDILIGALFVVAPFWSLFLVVFQFFKTRRASYTVLISSFFAIVASLLAPTGDLYRLYIMYFDFQNYHFDEFLEFVKYKPDFLFYFLLYLFAKIGWSIRILIFIVIFGYFQLSFKLLLNHGRKIGTLAILLFILQFDFLLQGLFLRFPMAMLVVIYAFLNQLKGRKYVLSLLILASMIHFAALVSIGIYFLTRLSFKKIQLILLFSIILMPFGNYFLSFVAEILLDWYPNMPFAEKINDYLLG